MAKDLEIIEEELIYGARRRERHLAEGGPRRRSVRSGRVSVRGCRRGSRCGPPRRSSSPTIRKPAWPFRTLRSGAVRVTENEAIIEAEVFRYVTDRETYNQLDNDLRVRRVLEMSDGGGGGLDACSLEQRE